MIRRLLQISVRAGCVGAVVATLGAIPFALGLEWLHTRHSEITPKAQFQ